MQAAEIHPPSSVGSYQSNYTIHPRSAQFHQASERLGFNHFIVDRPTRGCRPIYIFTASAHDSNREHGPAVNLLKLLRETGFARVASVQPGIRPASTFSADLWPLATCVSLARIPSVCFAYRALDLMPLTVVGCQASRSTRISHNVGDPRS